MYDKNKEKRKLEIIKNRYIYNGLLRHHGDCSIYKLIDVYNSAACTCGLLHDLKIVAESIKIKLYPKYYKELCLEDGPPKDVTEEEKEQIENFLKSFLPEVELDKIWIDPDWKEICDSDWELIKEVFGEEFCASKELEFLESNYI